MAFGVLAIVSVDIADFGRVFGAETWLGLVIAPEDRCAPYDRDEYRYSQSVEAEIVAAMGGRIYGPYTGRHFSSTRRTDIELCDVQHNSINVALTIMLRRAWLLWPRAGTPRITAT